MFASNSKVWVLGLFVALGVLSSSLFHDFTAPWTTNIDSNGAWWSQSAHNTLRAGLRATGGVPSWYFGPLPIPPAGYYTHHPPLLSLMLTGMFALFGEKEWAARLLPIMFSLASVVLLWTLVKECAGRRAAAFTVVLFAATPMELVYGRMVNFEPINLVWMLAGLLCLRRWEQTGQRHWRNLMIIAFVLTVWTAWLGYIFVLLVCLYFLFSPKKRNPRMALILLGLSLLSITLFLLHIRWARPGAWQNLMGALNFRLARTNASGINVTWADWTLRICHTLTSYILPFSWALGVLGTVWLVQLWKTDESLRWLGFTALCFFAQSVLYIVFFPNASYVHAYAAFYVALLVAIMGGLAIELLLRWCEARGAGIGIAGLAVAMAMCFFQIFSGQRQAVTLNTPVRILDLSNQPADLIPELGRLMHEKFAEGTTIIHNYGWSPHLLYYAQCRPNPRRIATPDDWAKAVKDPAIGPVGCVIWLGKANAKEILAALPAGSREEINVRGIPFCFWKPNR
jgi:4-amino-4-deoxy-L-arabinose transferase-like glycosyltransferase